jgi:single-stranded DNA-binding protein
MPSASAVVAIGTVVRLRDFLSKDETLLCAVQISVTSLRRVDGEEIETIDRLTVVTGGEQAENCREYLQTGRSVGVLAELIGEVREGRAVGRASALYFIGRDSAATPSGSPDEGVTAKGRKVEPALAA